MWIPLPLLGIPPWMVFASFSVNLIYQFWVHTERIDKLWRPIEFIFNTPSHHRVHHGMDAEYLDKNYAGILIIWDRMFGTFQPEMFRPHYGLTKPVNTFNIWKLQTREYVAIARDVRRATPVARPARLHLRSARLGTPPGRAARHPRPDHRGQVAAFRRLGHAQRRSVSRLLTHGCQRGTAARRRSALRVREP